MASEQDIALAQYALDVRKAIREGKLHVRPEHAQYVAELMAAPVTGMGTIDVSALSAETNYFIRIAGTGLRHMRTMHATPAPGESLPAVDAQVKLFRLFGIMFTALTGTGPDAVTGEGDIQQRLLWRFKHEAPALAQRFNAIAEELEDFYRKHAVAMFMQAKELGGMKLVTGGQRSFRTSALHGIRITALYADTQLIPDPVYPFLAGDLHLNAMHLQLAIALYYILQLAPLVEAKLPVPPVFVFPSFESQLEEHDAVTKLGLSELTLQLVAPRVKARSHRSKSCLSMPNGMKISSSRQLWLTSSLSRLAVCQVSHFPQTRRLNAILTN